MVIAMGSLQRKDTLNMNAFGDTHRIVYWGRDFADILQCNFFNEKVWIEIKISLLFVPKGPINNEQVLV